MILTGTYQTPKICCFFIINTKQAEEVMRWDFEAMDGTSMEW